MAGNGGKRPGAGRPKGAKNKSTEEVRELFAPLCPKAAKAIEALVDNPEHPNHFAASQEVLNRVYGRPKQVQQHTGPDGGAVEIKHTSAALEILQRLEAIAARKES